MQQSSPYLINERPLLVLPSLACIVGLHGAIVLQQVQFWLSQSEKIHEGRRWTYNTYEEWHKQFPFWNAEAIRKIIKKLEGDGYLIGTNAYNRNKFDHTKWYSIDYAKLDAALATTSGKSDGIDPENFPDRTGESSASSRPERPDRTGESSASEAEHLPLPLTKTPNTSKNGTPSLSAAAPFFLPDDFTVTADMRALIADLELTPATIANETAKFRAYCRSHGVTSFRWIDQWELWMRREPDHRSRNQSKHARRDEPDEGLDPDKYQQDNYLQQKGRRP